MKKILSVLTAVMLLLSMSACSNSVSGKKENNVKWADSKEICLSITLPASKNRSVEYYSIDDAYYYVVKLMDKTIPVDFVNGMPGESNKTVLNKLMILS